MTRRFIFSSGMRSCPPTQPGVAMYVVEIQDATFVDVWENVPKAQ